MAIPFLGDVTEELEQQLRCVWVDGVERRVTFDRKTEQVFHINVLATHGEGRYPREWHWIPRQEIQ